MLSLWLSLTPIRTQDPDADSPYTEVLPVRPRGNRSTRRCDGLAGRRLRRLRFVWLEPDGALLSHHGEVDPGPRTEREGCDQRVVAQSKALCFIGCRIATVEECRRRQHVRDVEGNALAQGQHIRHPGAVSLLPLARNAGKLAFDQPDARL